MDGFSTKWSLISLSYDHVTVGCERVVCLGYFPGFEQSIFLKSNPKSESEGQRRNSSSLKSPAGIPWGPMDADARLNDVKSDIAHWDEMGWEEHCVSKAGKHRFHSLHGGLLAWKRTPYNPSSLLWESLSSQLPLVWIFNKLGGLKLCANSNGEKEREKEGRPSLCVWEINYNGHTDHRFLRRQNTPLVLWSTQ